MNESGDNFLLLLAAVGFFCVVVLMIVAICSSAHKADEDHPHPPHFHDDNA